MNELEQALKCSDGTCGHHPQFDCHEHHPNPELSKAYRELEFEIAKLKLENINLILELRDWRNEARKNMGAMAVDKFIAEKK